MSGMRKWMTIGIMMLMLTPVFSIVDIADAVTPEGWTFIVFCGTDNNLEKQVPADLQEMVDANSEIDLVVMYEGLEEADTHLVHIKNGVLTELPLPEELDKEINVGSTGPYIVTIDFVEENFPAEHYGLVFYNHGKGWYGVNDDWSQNDVLVGAEVTVILQYAYQTLGGLVDIVGYDACYMGQLDVFYDTKDWANIMVSSQDTEIWDGWNWNFLSVCDDDSTREFIATQICDYYVVDAIVDQPRSYTLSAINLTRFDSHVMESFNLLFQELSITAGSDLFKIVASIESSSTYIDKSLFHFYDLYDFASEVKDRFSDPVVDGYAQDLMDNITYSVINNRAYTNHGEGIGFYIGIGIGELYFPFFENYLCQHTSFDEFMFSFLSKNNRDFTVPDEPTVSVSNGIATLGGGGIQWKVGRGRWRISPANTNIFDEALYVRSYNGEAYSRTVVTNVTVSRVAFISNLIGRTISFEAGWNIFTPFAIKEDSTTASSLIVDIGLTDTKIALRTIDGIYTVYFQGRSRDDFPLERGEAYYICVSEDVDITVEGIVEATQSIELESGMNFFGFYANIETTAEELIDSNPYVRYVVKKDGGQYLTYFPGTEKGNNFAIRAGDGIYVYATSSGGLSI